MRRWNDTRSSLRIAALALLVSSSLSGCFALWDFGPFPGPPLPTIDGPEDPALLDETHGTVIALDHDDSSHLLLVSLPGLGQRKVPLQGRGLAIGAPDAKGRVAYIAIDSDHRGDWYRIRVLSLVDGSDTVLVERKGDLAVNSEISSSFSTGLVAFTSSIDRGGYDFTPWRLEVLDLDTLAVTPIEGEITQHRPQWLPDGRHLAFSEWQARDRTISTSIIDVLSGERRCIRAGKKGAMIRGASLAVSMLLLGEGGYLDHVDALNGSLVDSEIVLPGSAVVHADPTNSWSVVGDLGDGKFLYDGLPTTGVKQELRQGSMWPEDVKLGDTRTGAFVTVVSQLWGVARYGAFDLPAMQWYPDSADATRADSPPTKLSVRAR